MKVAVITPYFQEPLEVLERCRDSVRGQTHPDTHHVLVSDGVPQPQVDGWDGVTHLRVPTHGDFGDTPRALGALSAMTLGADAIAFLDADNWYDPDHLEKLITLHQATGAQVVTATRTLFRQDGAALGVCRESNGRDFNDTNCYLLLRPAFRLIPAWVFKNRADAITGDRLFWQAVLRSGLPRAHCDEPTVNYVTHFAGHYRAFGLQPPPDSKMIVRLPNEPHSRQVTFAEYERMVDGRPG